MLSLPFVKIREGILWQTVLCFYVTYHNTTDVVNIMLLHGLVFSWPDNHVYHASTAWLSCFNSMAL